MTSEPKPTLADVVRGLEEELDCWQELHDEVVKTQAARADRARRDDAPPEYQAALAEQIAEREALERRARFGVVRT